MQIVARAGRAVHVRRRRARALRERERVALGVLADRPALARMHDAAAERRHLRERRRDLVDLEVRQRERVARAATARVDADGRAHARSAARALRALALSSLARLQRDAEQPAPEAACALRIVSRELDQRERRCHATTLARRRVASRRIVARRSVRWSISMMRPRPAGRAAAVGTGCRLRGVVLALLPAVLAASLALASASASAAASRLPGGG